MKIEKINSFKPAFKANVMPKDQAEYLDNKLKSADTVDIFCHTSTDEDSFNSAKTLYLYLEKLGKSPRILTSDESDNFGYDKSRYNILTFDDVDSETKKADLAACVDFCKKERMATNVLDYLGKYNEKNIIGFDHHNDNSYLIPDTRHITQQYKSVADIPIEKPKNYYIDSSAKSCSAIMYRFLSAIGEPISKEQLTSIFCGMSDDMNKAGFVKFLDKFRYKFTPKSEGDENSKEVYSAVAGRLKEREKANVITHLDVMATLSDEEKAFQKKLFDSIQLSKNKKFAYVALDPNDEQWIKLGGDTKRTSVMLRDFRVRTLNNDANDKIFSKSLHKKLNDVQAVAVFYSNPEEGIYKISIHTNEDYAKKYNDYIRENLYPELTAGGHSNRGGGRILTLDKEKCLKWVNYFKEASENVQYS